MGIIYSGRAENATNGRGQGGACRVQGGGRAGGGVGDWRGGGVWCAGAWCVEAG
jgi:hypothetical protein